MRTIFILAACSALFVANDSRAQGCDGTNTGCTVDWSDDAQGTIQFPTTDAGGINLLPGTPMTIRIDEVVPPDFTGPALGLDVEGRPGEQQTFDVPRTGGTRDVRWTTCFDESVPLNDGVDRCREVAQARATFPDPLIGSPPGRALLQD